MGAILRRFWVLLLVGGLAVGGYMLRDVLSGNAGQLKVGDCFDVPADQTDIRDVQHHPCKDAHDAEVFAVVTYGPAAGSAAYPTVAAFSTFVDRECLPAFKTYTGWDFHARGDLGAGYFYPQSTGWSKGDRTVICYLNATSGLPLRTSMRASPAP